MEHVKVIAIVFAFIFFVRWLVWLLSWYSYQHPRAAEITEDDILTLEHEYKKLVADYRKREKKRSMK